MFYIIYVLGIRICFYLRELERNYLVQWFCTSGLSQGISLEKNTVLFFFFFFSGLNISHNTECE